MSINTAFEQMAAAIELKTRLHFSGKFSAQQLADIENIFCTYRDDLLFRERQRLLPVQRALTNPATYAALGEAM